MSVRPRAIKAAKALVWAFAVLAAGAAVAVASPRLAGDDPNLRSTAGGTFRIRGDVGGLLPGRPASLPVTVENRNRFPIVVRSVYVTAKTPGAGCPASTLKVTPFKGSLRVPARASRRLALRIVLAASAPDACAGARFALSYSGSAVKG